MIRKLEIQKHLFIMIYYTAIKESPKKFEHKLVEVLYDSWLMTCYTSSHVDNLDFLDDYHAIEKKSK
jgi:hypothetical protein